MFGQGGARNNAGPAAQIRLLLYVNVMKLLRCCIEMIVHFMFFKPTLIREINYDSSVRIRLVLNNK